MNHSQASNEQFCIVNDGIELCYRREGDPAAPAVVLVLGLGLQLTYWPRSLIDALLAQQLQVIWFDNRDVGRSTHVDTATPSKMDLLLAKKLADAYSLSAMATDTIGLLDALSIERAHIIGMSMGGMIGQLCAANYPHRVQSLTSIFSTTGAKSVGQPALSTLWHLLKPAANNRRHAVRHYCDMAQHIAESGYPCDLGEAEAYAQNAWQRGQGDAEQWGIARQLAAIIKSGNRSKTLEAIRCPTLVIHGDKDNIVHPSGGEATAAAIAGAQLEIIDGLGHYINQQAGSLIAEKFRQLRTRCQA